MVPPGKCQVIFVVLHNDDVFYQVRPDIERSLFVDDGALWKS
jgi:hypothetical protein